MTDIYLLSLGCPKNTSASQKLKHALVGLGFNLVDAPEGADIIIVNTCGFIEPAKEESIESILELGRLKKNNPKMRLIAVGCLVQRYHSELAKDLPEVDIFLDLKNLKKLPELLGLKTRLDLSLQMPAEEPFAYVEIADGCDYRCSFCAIPSIRGPFRSRSEGEILRELDHLRKSNFREVVLVGQDTGSYGKDLSGQFNLVSLIGKISQLDHVDWIRLLYMQPQDVNGELIDEISANPKICSYLDIPFQHASSGVLRRMNRWGDKDEYLDIIASLRTAVPGIALRSSIIVGFPGENDEDMMLLSDFLKEAMLDYVGIFEFSVEEGTAAAELPGHIEDQVKRERADRLRLMADELAAKRHKRFLGQTLKVLIDKCEGSISTGRSQYQAPEIDAEVLVEGDHCPGEFLNINIEEYHDYVLVGSAARCRT